MYKLLKNGYVSKDGEFIPNDVNNSKWREYLSWVDAGNTPEPVDIDIRRSSVKVSARSYRDLKVSQAVSYADKAFDGSVDAQRTLGALVSSLNNGDSANFTANDGTRASYTRTQLVELLQAMVIKDQLAYNRYAQLVAEIYVSDNPESINVTTGW